MGPTTVFCPNLACPARGQTGQGNIRVHSRKDQRFICLQCHKTFTATKGTVFYRLGTSTETVALVRDLTIPWLSPPSGRSGLWVRGAHRRRLVGSRRWSGAGRAGISGRATTGFGAGASRREPREDIRGHRLDGAGHDGQEPVVAGWRSQRATRHAVDSEADRACASLCPPASPVVLYGWLVLIRPRDS
jgi:hypothetical protein